MTWQDAPGWKLVDYDPAGWERRGERPPGRPTLDAELAQPPIWASLYAGGRPIATWFLNSGMTTAQPDATLVPCRL